MTMYETQHPVSNIPSEELDDSEVAFKILNQDNLPIAIVGENIFKPFGGDGFKLKPNGIVYPTRRILGNLQLNQQKAFTRSNGYIAENNQNLNKDSSISHDNINHCNSAAKTRETDDKEQLLDPTFNKVLGAKLRKLQKEEKQVNKPDLSRRPFVTTVKKGNFLEPTHEVVKSEPPVYKGCKKLYAYASKPRVLSKVDNNAHKSRCETAAKAAATMVSSIAGVHQLAEKLKDSNSSASNKNCGDAPIPYSNLMFEKRVFRGSNYAQPLLTLPKWNPNFAYAKLLSYDNPGEGESAAARAAEARRRALARRKAKKQQVRGAQLRLGSPPPVPGRRHEPVQTELYLEEIWNSPPTIDICTQTDLFLDRPASPFFVPAKSGADVETQIYAGDLFDFDMEVQPILEVLVGKTIEQALIEVLEEEELAALREQQRQFLEIRATETAETQRLAERERRFQIEKDRRVQDYEQGMQSQKEMEERIAAAVLMQGYMADLLPSVLEGLEEEGFLTDNIKQDVSESFMPWLMKEVTNELQEMVSSRDVLTDLVKEILENRAELYRALYSKKEDSEDEEEYTQDDIVLAEHFNLKEEIAKPVIEDDKQIEMPGNYLY